MRFEKFLPLLFALLMPALAAAQGFPADRLLSDTELVAALDTQRNPALGRVRQRFAEDPDAGLEALAAHFREAFPDRYYFDWRNAEARFDDYRARFPSRESGHRAQAAIHEGLYAAEARWKLPYRNLKGNEVSAYELRHLARQHKVLDMAFVHLYDDRDPRYVDYFATQMRSLNAAFGAGEFEDDEGGNGVYESFRAGYRVLNWLQVHAFYLGSPDYRWQDQVELIRTMLHTGAVLHEKNRKFRYGNHQTRGAVALAMIAILFRDFGGTEAWYHDAMAILGGHLEKEVNADGFQFERSVHYHVGDIYNYFRVLQLAQLNGFPVPDAWRSKLRAMFEAAVVLARPDRRLPVLQDDTDSPWSEFNEMGDFMLLGALLFDDPVINYFAGDSVAPAVYWLVRDDQVASIPGLERKRPQLGSAVLPDTGYYVMRDGWDEGDRHMVITAGLSAQKPDHQHGDMLGLVARANGQEILPNYQVRYSLPDYAHFKNSFVKNVALVDGIPHGREWKGNRGGSGFGKFLRLPRPRVIAWVNHEDWDFFAGTHDGYADLGVHHYRKVLFLKGLGWIVRDVFESSSGEHDFQQVWQGHYSEEGDNHHRSAFADGSGLEILQLGDPADTWSVSSKRGKGNLVYTLSGERGDYTTLLYPHEGFSSRIPDSFFSEGRVTLNGWILQKSDSGDAQPGGFGTDARLIFENDKGAFLLGARRITDGDTTLRFEAAHDVHVDFGKGGTPVLTLLGHELASYRFEGSGSTAREGRLEPGGRLDI